MASKPLDPKKIIVTARLSAEDVAELDRLGAEARPVPASRSEMVGVAVREYVERNGKARGKKG